MLPGMEPTARLTVLFGGVPAESEDGMRMARVSARERRSGRRDELAFMGGTTVSCLFDCCIVRGGFDR